MIGTMITHAATIGASLTGGHRPAAPRPGAVRVSRGRAAGGHRHPRTAGAVPTGFRARVASICATRCLLPQVGPFDVPAPGRIPAGR
jgi:hypothetical protein